MKDTIQSFMTPSVHTIGVNRTLAEAHKLMNDHNIRHLPVMEGGRLSGLLSMRDLHLIETLRDVDPKQVTVEEAMSQEVFAVSPDEPLAAVAGMMARRKYGSAVVTQGGAVLGIFTTTDACRVLDELLSAKPARRPARKTATRPSARKRAR